MRIGINASFLRKPGTGIGQVTANFLDTLRDTAGVGEDEFFLYGEQTSALEGYPDNFHFRHFLPFWKRDDVIRKILWERQVAHEAKKDGCTIFLSLYQSSTVAPSGMKHVMIVHDVIPSLFEEYRGNIFNRWHWQLVLKAIGKATSLLAVSQATKNDMVALGISAEKIQIAYPDAALLFSQIPSVEESARVMQRYKLTPGYIYHGGGLEVRKNARGLLRAYAKLRAKGAVKSFLPPLVISGMIFPETNKRATPVRTVATELGIVDEVRMLDFVTQADLPALYCNALFFVYPSYYEGFGLPVLEALRMGTPVLVADNSSLPEVAGEAGLYIDAENSNSIASGMERLLTDPFLRKSLSGKAVVQQALFSWQKFTHLVVATLKK